MKTSYKAALLAALGLTVVSGAQAQEMFLGLNDSNTGATAHNDYVLDLGSYTQFTTTATLNGTLNASTISAAFSSVDANYLNDVAVGAAAGASSPTKFFDQTGGFTPGMTTSQFNNNIGASASLLSGVQFGEYASSSTTGWSYNVAADPNNIGSNPSGSVASSTGNPMAFLSSGIVTETLYSAVVGGTARSPVITQSTLGTLSVDLNADTWSFQGSSVAVPEPTTYGLLAGAGLLLVGVRRQFAKKNA